MRGPPTLNQRAGHRPTPANEAIARTYAIPAPYKGWNARGNLANMGPLEAVVMDNIFPGVQDVALRPGRSDWVTGFSANVRGLMPYNGGASSKLFAATSAGVYDVTSSGTMGAVVTACTDGRWISVNFRTAGGSYLTMVNGVDSLKLYDGATWVTVTGVSVPAITGVTTSSLNYVSIHKKRQWFVEADTMNLWYLPVDSIAGAATQFPVGSLFKLGGYVVATGSWTLDSGSGVDDLFVIATSNGEIAVYQGTDPASSATWALVGVYEAGPPVGRRPLLDYGGDLLYLSKNGLIPLSKLVQSPVLELSSMVSFNIDGAMLDATSTYAANNGWQAILHRNGTALIVNVPVSADTLSYQYVMNVVTKAWCRFTGWNASCWAVLGSDIYFGGGTGVSKAWIGTSDAGTPITGQVAQSYNSFGMAGQKAISLVRPNLEVSGSATLRMAIDADFKTFNGQTLVTYTPISAGATWDSSLWDTGLWDAGASPVESKWLTVPNDLGYLHSFRLQLTTSSASFVWTSTNYAYKPAGIL